jgi:hypothetical protein
MCAKIAKNKIERKKDLPICFFSKLIRKERVMARIFLSANFRCKQFAASGVNFSYDFFAAEFFWRENFFFFLNFSAENFHFATHF